MFANRQEAGRQIARVLLQQGKPDPVIVAIPQGGVVVAGEVARMLHADIDLVMVSKLTAPDLPHLAIGAVDEEGEVVLNQPLIQQLHLTPMYVEAERQAKYAELMKRTWRYHAIRRPQNLRGRSVIVVDDGIITGTTMRSALRQVHAREPSHIIVAVPLINHSRVEPIRAWCDELICLCDEQETPAVGCHYEDFPDVTEEEVEQILTGESIHV